MIVEKVFHKQDIPQEQRRLNRQKKYAGATRGTKKTTIRRRVTGLSSEESPCEEDDEEDDIGRDGGRPPVLAVQITAIRCGANVHVGWDTGQVRGPPSSVAYVVTE